MAYVLFMSPYADIFNVFPTLPLVLESVSYIKVNDPVIPPLDVHTDDFKSTCHRDTCTSVFPAALHTTAELWGQPGGPAIEGRVRKM